MDHDHRLLVIESQGQRSKCKNRCATRVSTAAVYDYCLMVVVVLDFHCYVTSCELARRSLRRGAAENNGSGEVQRVWSGWYHDRSDLYPRSTAVFCFNHSIHIGLAASLLSGKENNSKRCEPWSNSCCWDRTCTAPCSSSSSSMFTSNKLTALLADKVHSRHIVVQRLTTTSP